MSSLKFSYPASIQTGVKPTFFAGTKFLAISSNIADLEASILNNSIICSTVLISELFGPKFQQSLSVAPDSKSLSATFK